MAISMTPRDAGFTVKQGNRSIGFINLWTIRGESAWRFVTNRADIAARYPVPAPEFGSAQEVLADVRARLDQ